MPKIQVINGPKREERERTAAMSHLTKGNILVLSAPFRRSEVEQDVERIRSKLGVQGRSSFQMRLVLSELLRNIINYTPEGYAEEPFIIIGHIKTPLGFKINNFGVATSENLERLSERIKLYASMDKNNPEQFTFGIYDYSRTNAETGKKEIFGGRGLMNIALCEHDGIVLVRGRQVDTNACRFMIRIKLLQVKQ